MSGCLTSEWQDMAPIFKLVKEVMAGREKK